MLLLLLYKGISIFILFIPFQFLFIPNIKIKIPNNSILTYQTIKFKFIIYSFPMNCNSFPLIPSLLPNAPSGAKIHFKNIPSLIITSNIKNEKEETESPYNRRVLLRGLSNYISPLLFPDMTNLIS